MVAVQVPACSPGRPVATARQLPVQPDADFAADQPPQDTARDPESEFWKTARRRNVTESRFPARASQPAPDRSHPAMAVNLDALLHCCQAALPDLLGAEAGSHRKNLNNYTLSPISDERVSEAAGVNSAAGSFGLSFGLAFAGAIMLATLSIAFTPNAVTPSILRTLRKPGPSASASTFATA